MRTVLNGRDMTPNTGSVTTERSSSVGNGSDQSAVQPVYRRDSDEGGEGMMMSPVIIRSFHDDHIYAHRTTDPASGAPCQNGHKSVSSTPPETPPCSTPCPVEQATNYTPRKTPDKGRNLSLRTPSRSNGLTPENGSGPITTPLPGNSGSNSGGSSKPLNVTTRRPRIKSNPFRLTTCQDFTEEESPFTIALSVESLCLIDAHAHLDEHEVIGLLGGNYQKTTRELHIDMAVPCRAEKSSNRDCEMDAASQWEGAEKIFRSQRKVVGWYHSHPTFQDNPSGRDIETQTSFQQHWCRSPSAAPSPYSLTPIKNKAMSRNMRDRKSHRPTSSGMIVRHSSNQANRSRKRSIRSGSLSDDGSLIQNGTLGEAAEHADGQMDWTDETTTTASGRQDDPGTTGADEDEDQASETQSTVPFVGMILSPYFSVYSKSAQEPMRSQFKCLIVQDGIPYQVRTRIVRRDRIKLQLPLYVGQMCRWIWKSKTKLKLDERLERTNLTIAQKLIESISSFLRSAGLSKVEIGQLTEDISSMLHNNYRGEN